MFLFYSEGSLGSMMFTYFYSTDASVCQKSYSKAHYVFVVLVVVPVAILLVVETRVKNVPNRTKIVQRNKKCASVAHYGI